VTTTLLDALTNSRLAAIMVVHSNHANEIDEDVAAAFGRIRKSGMLLLNQSVLLAGINDSAAVLAALSERLFAAGALPYYLHLLDKVAGAAHFDVDETRAKALHREISTVLPGYLLPKLVREIAGAPAKVAI
jgi:L-lysine 2,3-aminomutase